MFSERIYANCFLTELSNIIEAILHFHAIHGFLIYYETTNHNLWANVPGDHTECLLSSLFHRYADIGRYWERGEGECESAGRAGVGIIGTSWRCVKPKFFRSLLTQSYPFERIRDQNIHVRNYYLYVSSTTIMRKKMWLTERGDRLRLRMCSLFIIIKYLVNYINI